jgi:Cytochrome P450
MIEAGSETTSAMLNNALIGLLSNPDSIVAAHEELDRVIGGDRPPNFDDEKDLPYMRGIIKVRSDIVKLMSRSYFDGDQSTNLVTTITPCRTIGTMATLYLKGQ